MSPGACVRGGPAQQGKMHRLYVGARRQARVRQVLGRLRRDDTFLFRHRHAPMVRSMVSICNIRGGAFTFHCQYTLMAHSTVWACICWSVAEEIADVYRQLHTAIFCCYRTSTFG
jgi:hypothetical protein